jgi:hypothetical protein
MASLHLWMTPFNIINELFKPFLSLTLFVPVRRDLECLAKWRELPEKIFCCHERPKPEKAEMTLSSKIPEHDQHFLKIITINTARSFW